MDSPTRSRRGRGMRLLAATAGVDANRRERDSSVSPGPCATRPRSGGSTWAVKCVCPMLSERLLTSGKVAELFAVDPKTVNR